MSVEVEDVIRRLLRRALSVIYVTVGFFLILTWVWGNYVGVIALVIAYLVCASILYPHVFRPLIKFREVTKVLSRGTTSVFKVFGSLSSAFGLAAVALLITKQFYSVPTYLVPLMGALATLVSLVAMVLALLKSPKLYGLPEALATAVLGLAIVLYFIRPSTVLPITGASFMCLGMYTYYFYYVRAGEGF